MTREEEIRARLEKATPGPWKVHMDDVGDEEECMVSTGIQDLTGYSIVDSDGGLLPWTGERMYSESDANAEFISNAPSDIDYLLKQNQQLRDANNTMAAYLQSLANPDAWNGRTYVRGFREPWVYADDALRYAGIEEREPRQTPDGAE